MVCSPPMPLERLTAVTTARMAVPVPVVTSAAFAGVAALPKGRSVNRKSWVVPVVRVP